MDNFVNFLLDYYPYILGVLGIIIVTIIGYLADSKKKREKKLNNTDNKGKSETKEEVKMGESTTENATPIMEAVNEVAKPDTTEQINNVVSTPTNEVVSAPVNNIQNNVPVNSTVPQTSNVTEPVNNQVPNVVSTNPVNQVVQPNVQANVVNSVPVQNVQQVPYTASNQIPQQVVQPVSTMSPVNQTVQPTNQVEQPVVPQPINAVNLNQMVNGQTTYPNQGYIIPQAIPQPMPNQQVVQTPVTPMPNVESAPAATPVNTAPIAGLNFVTGKTPETEKDEEEVWKL